MRESDLQRAVSDYLEYQMNLGKLVYLRLNSGDFIEVRGNTRRRIKGCSEGTSDFIVIRRWYPVGAPNKAETLVMFLELKSDKGKQSLAQGAFEILVKNQCANYHIIKDIDTLINILGD